MPHALPNIEVASIVLICIAAFAASIVDAMVGGGGLISVPALFLVFPGVPPSVLLATNKFSMTFGAAAAVIRYSRSGQVPWLEVRWPAAVAMVAAMLGGACMTRVDPQILRPLVLALLIVVLVATLARKDLGAPREEIPRDAVLGLVIGAVLGFYEGFFGPGTGSFLLFLYVALYGFSFLKATAAGRVVNFAASVGALGYFLSQGLILYQVAVPMCLCTILGGTLGSHLAITRGSRWIRLVFIFVVLAVIGKFAYELVR